MKWTTLLLIIATLSALTATVSIALLRGGNDKIVDSSKGDSVLNPHELGVGQDRVEEADEFSHDVIVIQLIEREFAK